MFVSSHSWRGQTIIGHRSGMAWRWEHEAAGYTASTVRKQRERNTGSQLSFSFLVSLGPQLIEQAVCI